MIAYVRSFITLFVLLGLLLYLPPGKSYQKYIRFFAEMILTISLMSPVMSIFFDSTEFLERIEYAEFMESLSEISRDMEKIEYINNDGYKKEYEEAIAADVRVVAEKYIEEENMASGEESCVQDVEVTLGDDYTVEQMQLWIAKERGGEIVIGQIILQDGSQGETEDEKYAALKKELSGYYQIETDRITIRDA